MTLAFQEELGELFVKVSGKHSLEELRALSAEGISALIPAFFGEAMPKAKGLFLVPTIDGCLEFCRRLAEAEREPAWMYYFTRRLPGNDAGAFHSSELWYMFGTLDRCWRPMGEADHALSDKMLDYWTNFMRCGNPNGDGKGIWKPCGGESENIMVFDCE